MAVGKGSIQRAVKAAEKAPVKKTAAKKEAAKEVKEVNKIGIGTELPIYLL